MVNDLKDVAFYYPGHDWNSFDWIKTLLLFFDGVGLLVPKHRSGSAERLDPLLAGPLRDQGLLHYLISDQVVDKAATERLVTALTKFITSGAFDSFARDDKALYEVSMSRMGFYGDWDAAEKLFETLKAYRLDQKSVDRASMPVHSIIRYLILTLLAQILRPRGAAIGLELSPATDQRRFVSALTGFLRLPKAPSAGNVVAIDPQSVSVDLSAVPLDEVLGYRADHGTAHRTYIRKVRAFASELSLMPETERPSASKDRQSELDDLAADLKRTSWTAWRRPASFAIGLAGAAWSLRIGDAIGALLAALGAITRTSENDTHVNAYSYVFASWNRNG